MRERLRSHVREVREQVGLSVQLLAEESGVAVKTILLCEAGRIDPPLTTALLLADALGVDVEDLFARQTS